MEDGEGGGRGGGGMDDRDLPISNGHLWAFPLNRHTFFSYTYTRKGRRGDGGWLGDGWRGELCEMVMDG